MEPLAIAVIGEICKYDGLVSLVIGTNNTIVFNPILDRFGFKYSSLMLSISFPRPYATAKPLFS